MKKYQVVLGYLTKLNHHKKVERFEISAADKDDALNKFEVYFRNYRGKSKADRIWGQITDEKLDLLRIKYHNVRLF